MKISKKTKGSLMLLITAIIWGAAFVAQDKGMDLVDAFTFNGVRMIIGSVVLIPVICIFTEKDEKTGKKNILPNKTECIGGAICGVLLFIASSFQQYGIAFYGDNEAAAGKSGFITALYVIMVPIVGLFLHKKVPATLWISIGVAILGMYLLCVTSNFGISLPDALLLMCAISFTFQILAVDYYSPRVTSGIKLSSIQFLVCGILGIICMFIFEKPNIKEIFNAWIPILYAGVLSSGVAYTLQIIAQKHTSPAVASIIMSLEAVFAALTGALFGERLTTKEILGCSLVFIAVIMAQIDIPALIQKTYDKRKKNKMNTAE